MLPLPTWAIPSVRGEWQTCGCLPTGAAGSIAASPDEESQAFLADADARELVEHTLRLSECDGLGVDALFFVGGYSVLYLPAPFEHAFPHAAQCSLPGLC